MLRDLGPERRDALWSAAQLHDRKFHNACDVPAVLATADAMFAWLTAPIQLYITRGPGVDQTTGTHTDSPGGNPMKDNEKAQLNVQAVDAKSQPTDIGADIQWSSADESIASITTDADGTWVVAGVPGSTVITALWPDSPMGSISGTLAIDVTSGEAVSLSVTAGAPVPQ